MELVRLRKQVLLSLHNSGLHAHTCCLSCHPQLLHLLCFCVCVFCSRWRRRRCRWCAWSAAHMLHDCASADTCLLCRSLPAHPAPSPQLCCMPSRWRHRRCRWCAWSLPGPQMVQSRPTSTCPTRCVSRPCVWRRDSSGRRCMRLITGSWWRRAGGRRGVWRRSTSACCLVGWCSMHTDFDMCARSADWRCDAWTSQPML